MTWRSHALSWALDHLPRESCGVVIIEKGREVFIRCRNISDLDNAFEIHPEDFALAEDRGEIVRIVHSHCYGPADPSETDLVACESSGLPWSIVSVPRGTWHDFEPSGFVAPLVGRVWAHGVADCYTLIRDYYARELKIVIPDFDRKFEWWLKGKNLYAENFEKAGFRKVPIESLRKHDVLLIQIASPVVNHGAVYLGDEIMLHHLHNRLSCRDVFGGYWAKHCVYVLRHEKLL